MDITAQFDVGTESEYDNFGVWEEEEKAEKQRQKDLEKQNKEQSKQQAREQKEREKLMKQLEKIQVKRPQSSDSSDSSPSLSPNASPMSTLHGPKLDPQARAMSQASFKRANNNRLLTPPKEMRRAGSSGALSPRKDSYTKLAVNPNTFKKRPYERGDYSWKNFRKIGLGSTVAPVNAPVWVIAESSVSFCESLWEYFFDCKKVKIVNCDSIKELPSAEQNYQALVLCGNVFGFAEPTKAWKDVENLVGVECVESVRHYIRENYVGEAPPYAAFLVPVENHPSIKYLLYSASNLVGNNTHIYSTVWSILLALIRHNKEVSKTGQGTYVTKFVSLGFLSLYSGEDESSRQTFLAYHNLLSPPSEAPTTYLDAKEEALAQPAKINMNERCQFVVDMVETGELEKRGFITEDTIEFVVCLFAAGDDVSMFYSDMSPENMQILKKAAAKTIVRYTYPVETVPGTTMLIVNKGALHPLLDLVLSGEITAHVEIDPSELEQGELIAEGGSGRVYVGKWKGIDVAIKRFSEAMISFSLEEFRKEVAIMSLLKHQNLIEFYGASTKNSSSLVIVTKLIRTGNLKDLLANPRVELSLLQKLKFAIEIAAGMAFLHSKGFMHRDLKSLNVMIDEDGTVKVIDFGTSRPYMAKKSLMTETIGTPIWMAPEIFNNEKYTEKADVYSFGIVMWEIITRLTPYEDLPQFSIPVAVSKGTRPPIPKEAPLEYAKLMKNCWSAKPQKRPSFTEAQAALEKIYQTILLQGGISPTTSASDYAMLDDASSPQSSPYTTLNPHLQPAQQQSQQPTQPQQPIPNFPTPQPLPNNSPPSDRKKDKKEKKSWFSKKTKDK